MYINIYIQKKEGASPMSNSQTLTPQEILSHNLKTLRKYLGKSQRTFSHETDISTPTLSSYENGATLPSLEFLLYLKTTYHISIDDFMSRNMTVSDFSNTISASTQNTFPELPQNIYRYIGTYYLYYFGTAQKGDVHSKDPESLLHRGIMTLYRDTSDENSNLQVISCFNLKENAANRLFNEISESSQDQHLKETSKITAILRKYILQDQSNIYTGEVLLSPSNLFIQLDHANRDHGLLIFRNPLSEQKKYIGGIGCMNSVSKGYSFDPCIQYIGISRYILDVSVEDIFKELLIDSVEFDVRTETLELINLFKKLYIETDNSLLFSEEQKSCFIQSTLEKYIEKTINYNLFLTEKISISRDDNWYHFIKKYRKRRK